MFLFISINPLQYINVQYATCTLKISMYIVAKTISSLIVGRAYCQNIQILDRLISVTKLNLHLNP